jgi:hypothetical protein
MHTRRLRQSTVNLAILVSLALMAVGCGSAGSTPDVPRSTNTTRTQPSGPSLTGQDIGQAATATRAIFDRLLAESGTPFSGWVILNDLGTSGRAVTQSELVGRLAQALKTDETPVRAALAELVRQGLVLQAPAATINPELSLSPAGTIRFQQVQDGIKQIAQRLYGDLPPEDLATAHSVLATVTERANAELAR